MGVPIFPYLQSSKPDQTGMLETLSKAEEICPATLSLRNRGSPGPRAEGSSSHTPAQVLHGEPCPILAVAQLLTYCSIFLYEQFGEHKLRGMWSATALRARAQENETKTALGSQWLPATPRSDHSVWLSVSTGPSVLRSQQAFKSSPNNPKSIIMGTASPSLFYCFRFKCIPH